MKRQQIYTIATAFLIFFLLVSTMIAQQSKFDMDISSMEEVQASLETANRLASKDKLTMDEIHLIYFAEKQIGRCVWGVSERDSSLFGKQHIAAHNYYSDRTITEQCLQYVLKNRSRFRVVGDGWKGDNNFWEPTGFWAVEANKYYPNSIQSMEIEFDLEFKEFIRQFYIVEAAKGKTCQQYHEERLKKFIDVYLDVYTREEINQWPAECEKVREKFIHGQSKLLKKFQNAPFTHILQDIDPTTIVVIHSVC